jgi:dihydrolipoamide dehydrogenase
VERRDGRYVLRLDDGSVVEASGCSWPPAAATARGPRPRDGRDRAARSGIEVDERLRAAEGVWAIGDATGIMPFTHVGQVPGRVAAADILGPPGARDYRAVPRVVFCDPQVAAVGVRGTSSRAPRSSPGVARTATYTREYADHPGFLTLLSDGHVLTGRLRGRGPEAGEWLGQATLAVRAEVPLDVLRDTIQPFPTFSEAFVTALADLGPRDDGHCGGLRGRHARRRARDG